MPIKALSPVKELLLFFFCIAPLLSGCSVSGQEELTDKIALKIQSPGRIFSFTNKTFSQYSGETNSPFSDGWHGWTCREQRIFNDYELNTSNGKPDRQKAEVTMYPHKLVRNFGDITEELFLPDTLDAVFIRTKGSSVHTVTLKNTGIKSFVIEKNNLIADLQHKLPGYRFVIESNRKPVKASVSGDDLIITFEGSESETVIAMQIFPFGKNAAVLAQAETLLNNKKARLEKLLQANYIQSNLDDFNRAYLWAVASADALVTKQQMTGIFAGLPWFNNYWGRDTFISLPGAALIPGSMEAAKEILLSFANVQNKETGSKYFGRVPNRVTLNETIYNTADGTPWWVIMCGRYYQMTGDKDFLKKIYPSIKLAFDGAMKSQVDSYGFLLHDDADTWMDAVGPNGPWSPRGNRANDIQALWFNQIQITSQFAYSLQDSITGLRADIAATMLKNFFNDKFLNKEKNVVYDHLNTNGTADLQLRPNIYTVLNTPGLISDFRTRLNILLNSAPELISRRGVLSLSYRDENFHPYHQNLPYYVKDAAYHNGIMWQWNNGPAVSAMSGFGMADSAWVLMQEQTDQILNRGAAGTLAELMDVLAKPGTDIPALSGTFSQAWSLAEYIRNINDDFLGVHIDAPANAIYLIPQLPKKMQKAEFTKSFSGNTVKVLYDNSAQLNRVTVIGSQIDTLIDIGIALVNYAGANFQIKTDITQGDVLTLEVPAFATDNKQMKVFRNGSIVSVANDFYLDPEENKSLYNQFRFAVPEILPGLRSLKGPDYELLIHETVKAGITSETPVLSASDKQGDEKYIYPKNPHFKPGILDIQKFTISESDSLYHFSVKMGALSNPGWHNEYGFQLTLLSLMITTDNGDKSSSSPVNSLYKLPAGFSYTKNIVVGGGIEIRDAKNKVVAAYLPQAADVKNPIGSSETGMIIFSLPKRLIGKIDSKAKIIVLSGAQDDHGGAGVGVFRAVDKVPGEWSGGGRKSAADDLVYDILQIN